MARKLSRVKSEGGSWLDQARRLAEYRREALEFLARVSQNLKVEPGHARAVSQLWLAADEVDLTLCSLLEEMNLGLLKGKGKLDFTRGAGLRTHGSGEALFYECTWSLLWSQGHGVAVNLGVEPENEAFDLRVMALLGKEEDRLAYPIDDDALKFALSKMYAAEADLDASIQQPVKSRARKTSKRIARRT